MFSKFDKISLGLGSVSLLALFIFFYCVIFPGKAKVAVLQNQIQLAQLSMDEFPMQVRNQSQLQDEIRERQDYLHANQSRIPEQADVHSIIEQISVLARENHVEIIRLEPRSILKHRSYTELPFQLEMASSTSNIQQFLYDLEKQERLFKIENISLSGNSERTDQNITGEMNISIYTFYVESNDFADNNSSS